MSSHILTKSEAGSNVTPMNPTGPQKYGGPKPSKMYKFKPNTKFNKPNDASSNQIT